MLNFYDGMKVYMNGEYPTVCINGKNQHVHRLVWMKHHGAIPEGFIIHHKDEDKTNWNIDNLEMISRSDHIMKHQNNLHSHITSLYGDQSRNHKLTLIDVEYIKKNHVKYDKHFGARALAKQFGVTEQCVGAIVNGKNWIERR